MKTNETKNMTAETLEPIETNATRKAAAVAARIAECKSVQELLINRAVTYTRIEEETAEKKEARYLIDVVKDGAVSETMTNAWNTHAAELRKCAIAAWRELNDPNGAEMPNRNACINIVKAMFAILGVKMKADKKAVATIIRGVCGVDRNTDGTTKSPSRIVQDIARAHLIKHEQVERMGKHIVTDEELATAVADANKMK